MAKKKSSSVSVVVFGVLAVLWAAEVVFFYESLERAKDERDYMTALEAEKAEKLAELKSEAAHLQKYTHKLINDPEFVEQEARERLGGAVEGEVVIRAEGN